MKCPNCHHDTEGKQFWCQDCNNVFSYPPANTWNHLEYMLVWLNEQQHILTSGQYHKLRQDVHARQTKLEIDMRIPEIQAIEIAAQAEAEAVAREVEAALLVETAVPEPVPEPEPIKPEAVAEPLPIVEKAPPKPKPATPLLKPEPKEKRPLINWGNAWDKVVAAAVSGALLTGLLYLGAFMIVVAAGVLAVSFWDSFSTILQLFLIALVPTTFYIFGWLTRWKLALKQAGGVLTGIGMLLVAVDFAAVYQFGELAARGVDLTLYWFGASLICTLIFALTAWRLPSEFFGYITLLGMTSALVALVVLLGLPLAWTAAAVAFAGLLMLVIAWRLELEPVRFPNLAKSAKRLPYLALPLSQVLVIVIPGGFSFAQVVTFLLAAVGYGWQAWRYQSLLFAYAAIWSPLVAGGTGWLAADLSLEWAATGLALLAAVYIVVGWRLPQWIPDKFLKKDGVITAVTLTGFLLLFVAVLGGLVTITLDFIFTGSLDNWPGITALLLSTLILAGCARLYRQPRFILAASGLFILPTTIVLAHFITTAGWEQWAAWLMFSWVVLALIYMGLTIPSRHRPKTIPYLTYLNLWAQLLIPAALLGLFFNYIVVYAVFDGMWFNVVPTLIVLAAAILFYGIAALLHHQRHPALSPAFAGIAAEAERPLFQWPIGLLIPVWLAVAWSGSVFINAWLGVALAGLGLAYVMAGQLLARVDATYRLPWHAYAYLLALVGIVAALGDSYALILTLLLTVTSLALLSYLYQRDWETAVAALLFLWPVWLMLDLTQWGVDSYTLVYMLLAALAYVPLGIWFWRMGDDVPWRPHALALLIIGYGVAALSVVASVTIGTVPTGNEANTWISVAVPFIGTALTLYSLYYFRKVQVVKRPFAWATVILTILTYAELSQLLHIPFPYMALAWVGFALALMLTERLLSLRLRASALNFKWALPLCQPLQISAALLWLLSIGLTAQYPLIAFMITAVSVDLLPIILAQSVAVVMLILAARLYRTKWPLFLEPIIVFFPVTLFVIEYGQGMWTEVLGMTIVWLGLALVHLITAVFLDERPIRYSHGLYLGGYGLLAFVTLVSMFDRVANLVALGTVIGVALVSHWLVHNGRHHTFTDFMRLFWPEKAETLMARLTKTAFLFVAVYAFPVWLLLLLAELNVGVMWWGLALALLAPLYIAAGLRSRRALDVYAWPFYSAGYALTVIAAFYTIDDMAMLIVVLSLNAAVYAATSAIFKQAFWLYVTAVLVPVINMLILDDLNVLTTAWIAASFTVLAFLYLLLGAVIDQRIVNEPFKKSNRLALHLMPRENLADISAFALPFYASAYILSILALITAVGDSWLTIGIYSAAVVFYLFSVKLFKQTVFYYAVAWLAAISYHLLIIQTPLPTRWLGLSWIPLIVAYIAIGKTIFARQQPEKWRSRIAISSPALPFYLVAYVMSLSMMLLSQTDPLAFTLSLAAGSALYFVSASLFQHPAWFYPGLFTSHVALAAFFTINPDNTITPMIAIPYLAATWVTALVGYWFSREYPVVHKMPGGERVFSFRQWEFRFGDWPFLGHLLTPSWAQPFFLFTVLDIFVWQVVALGMVETAVFFGLGIFLLLGLFAMLWWDKALPVGALAFFLLAVVLRLNALDMRFGTRLVWLGGIGLGFYLLSLLLTWLTRAHPRSRLALWSKPLMGTAVFLTGITALLTLPLVITDTTATAFCLAFAGALYLALAYRGRYRQLGYAAAAMLQLAWILLLIAQDVRQPQLYAIPAGLYFFTIGFLERRRGRYLFACYLEGFGVTIILLTSFIQSLSPDGFVYFVLLMGESLLVIWTSAMRRVKIPFFIGFGFNVLNIVAQLIVLVNVYDINRWLVILGTGLLLIATGVYVERKRENIIDTAHVWKEALATWQ
ncbi:MAG: hypothetical protein KC449_06900 [Anaerolineales bacterium]|nr:hypothetical protein [Anaerolineales bacterium]